MRRRGGGIAAIQRKQQANVWPWRPSMVPERGQSLFSTELVDHFLNVVFLFTTDAGDNPPSW
jgi:hypothetical protein